MSIATFQITNKTNIQLHTNARALDEFTRALPIGFYTTFMTLNGGTKVMGLRAHLARLNLSGAESDSVDEKTLRARIAALVESNLPSESRVRIIRTKDSGSVYLATQPFEPLPASVYRNGARVITTPTARHDPRAKSTDFISESAAQRKLLGKDVFEILLTKREKILEGMTSNFYAVKGKTLITAERGILLGVTRRAVIRLARGAGMSVEYRAPNLGEKFDEAFLTSSSRGVVPIVSIDRQSVGQGGVGEYAKILMQSYWDYVKEHSEWIVDE